MLNFRFMKEYDLDDVISIYEKCFYDECNGKCENVKYRDGILLALIDNRIVGMVTIDYLYDNFLNEKYAYINNLCVDISYQNRNIGYELMNECEKVCRENGCKYIKLTSNKKRISAHRLYNKLGFQIYDTTVFKKNI